MRLGVPLIWFQGVAAGTTSLFGQVWLVAEETYQQQFVVALDEQAARELGENVSQGG